MMMNVEDFFRLLHPGAGSQIKPISIKLRQQLIKEEQLKNFSPELKTIYDYIFNQKKNPIKFEEVMPFQIKKTKTPICNKFFDDSQIIYKCYDCFIHESAVLCVKCFQNGQHNGHRFKKIQSGGGNCDCGNPLALKEQGFCVNHNGKVQIPQIPQIEQLKFQQIISNVLFWLFQIKNRKEPLAQVVFTTFIQYLKQLNEQSIFYNVMTSNLLTKKIGKQLCFIDVIFKIKGGTVCEAFLQLFFTLFSLQQFKVFLSDRYLDAYNNIQNFQLSNFHFLFIQLFANDDIVINVSKKYKNTIFIKKMNYNFQIYLDDINFFSSIAAQPSQQFYSIYFNKNRYIPFPFLDEIQSQLEQTSKMHMVDLVTKILKEENTYYYAYSQIFKKIKNNEQLLKVIVRGLFSEIIEKKYSYNKNKVILPFHRTFSVGLFTLFKGKIQAMSIQSIAKYLNVSQVQVETAFNFSLDLILHCFFQFAQTFAKRNYFDNYILIYARSGICCINFDYLLIKQIISVFLKKGKSFEDYLIQLLSQKLQQSSKKQDQKEASSQLLRTFISFVQVLIQSSVTSSAQIINNERLQLNNSQIKKQKSIIFRQILKTIGQANRQQIQVIQRYFLHSINDAFLSQNSQFNKATKKYSCKAASEVEEEQIGSFEYSLYISKTKTGQLLIKDKQITDQDCKNKKNKDKSVQSKLDCALPIRFIEQLCGVICNKASSLPKQERNNILIKFLNVVYKLKFFSANQNKYNSIQLIVKQLIPKQQVADSQNKQLSAKLRMQMLHKKKAEKQAKFLKKQAQVIKKIETSQKDEEQQQICLLCKDTSISKQNLCYFANLMLKKVKSQMQREKESFGFIYSSCFHMTHLACFKQLCQNNVRVNCPLCKSYSNIVLPIKKIQKQHPQSEGVMNRCINRIENIIKYLAKQQSLQITQYNRATVFMSFVSAFVQFIGFAGLYHCKKDTQQIIKPGKAEFQKKFGRITCALYIILQGLWNCSPQQCKNDIMKKMQAKIQILQNNEKKKQDASHKIAQKLVIFSSVKSLIIEYLLAKISEKEQPSIRKITNTYRYRINRADLLQIQQNLKIAFKSSKDQKQAQSFEIYQEVPQINKVQNFYKFYFPPRNMLQLFKIRDEATIKNCKNGHNVCICVQCQQIVCVDCQTLKKHLPFHGCESMYFSLLSGSLIIFTPKQYNMPSVYENLYRVPWTPEQKPDEFSINEQLYGKFTYNLAIHQIQNFIKNQFPSIFYSNGIIDMF